MSSTDRITDIEIAEQAAHEEALLLRAATSAVVARAAAAAPTLGIDDTRAVWPQYERDVRAQRELGVVVEGWRRGMAAVRATAHECAWRDVERAALAVSVARLRVAALSLEDRAERWAGDWTAESCATEAAECREAIRILTDRVPASTAGGAARAEAARMDAVVRVRAAEEAACEAAGLRGHAARAADEACELLAKLALGYWWHERGASLPVHGCGR